MTTAAKTETPTETTDRCQPSLVQVGDTFSRHSHGTIVQRIGDRFVLRNSHGFEWAVTENEPAISRAAPPVRRRATAYHST